MSGAQLKQLQAENEQLRDRVSILEGLLYGDEPLPVEWKLSPREGKLFRALVRVPIATSEYLISASARDYADADLPDTSTLRVLVFKTRRKLAPFGIEIHAHWGRGYSLDASVRERFKPKSALPLALEQKQ